MLTLPERMALIVRCPDLSDGARVTLMEILLHLDSGKVPSLNEMRRIRDTSKSTIQKHIGELVYAKVLEKLVSTNGSSKYRLSEERLLSLNGIRDPKMIRRWISKFEAAETHDPEVVASVVRRPKMWSEGDALNYFDLLGKRQGIRVSRSAREHLEAKKTFRQAQKFFGGGRNLARAIDFFAANHNRMGIEYNVAEFAKAESRIMHKGI